MTSHFVAQTSILERSLFITDAVFCLSVSVMWTGRFAAAHFVPLQHLAQVLLQNIQTITRKRVIGYCFFISTYIPISSRGL